MFEAHQFSHAPSAHFALMCSHCSGLVAQLRPSIPHRHCSAPSPTYQLLPLPNPSHTRQDAYSIRKPYRGDAGASKPFAQGRWCVSTPYIPTLRLCRPRALVSMSFVCAANDRKTTLPLKDGKGAGWFLQTGARGGEC